MITTLLRAVIKAKYSQTPLPEIVQSWLAKGIEDYIEEGIDLEVALGLKTEGFSGKSGRQSFWLEARNRAIIDAWTLVRKRSPTLSNRKAAHRVYALLSLVTNEVKEDIELIGAIEDAMLSISKCSSFTNPDSLWCMVKEELGRDLRIGMG